MSRLVKHSLREASGVNHVKVAVFDNQTLWTGANVAETYLTKRQDRYVVVNNAPLANAAEGAVLALCSAASHASMTSSSGTAAACRQLASQLRSSPDNPAFSPAVHDGDTVAFLCAQAGWAGVRQEEALMSALLSSASRSYAPTCLSSPYLNPTARLERLLAEIPMLNLLTASPECHGWAGAVGPAALVPAAYSELSYRALRRLLRRRRSGELSYREWSRDAWDFHAKGCVMRTRTRKPPKSKVLPPPPLNRPPLRVWVSPLDDESGGPLATLVGSSNYGVRSSRNDIELNCLLLTRNLELRGRLRDEWGRLTRDTAIVSLPDLQERRPGVALRAAALLARTWL
jgi:CDP-diacylglycerol--glycerol-3-phosphate 3-phosphatidyltransferase